MRLSLYHATAVGVVLFMLNSSPDERNLTISSTAREASLAAITEEQIQHHRNRLSRTQRLRSAQRSTVTRRSQRPNWHY
jgi:hypothetical protein